jgi:hypothetical protein
VRTGHDQRTLARGEQVLGDRSCHLRVARHGSQQRSVVPSGVVAPRLVVA